MLVLCFVQAMLTNYASFKPKWTDLLSFSRNSVRMRWAAKHKMKLVNQSKILIRRLTHFERLSNVTLNYLEWSLLERNGVVKKNTFLLCHCLVAWVGFQQRIIWINCFQSCINKLKPYETLLCKLCLPIKKQIQSK